MDYTIFTGFLIRLSLNLRKVIT